MLNTLQKFQKENYEINTGGLISKKKSLKAHHHFCKLMGCQFILTAVHTSPQKAWDAIRAAAAEITRIEKLISSWDANSQTSLINCKSGIAPVKVDAELFRLIERSLKVSKITAGAFDISGTLSRYYWKFNQQNNRMLSIDKIHELRDLINFKKIELNYEDKSVFLKKAGMKIGFGGIGKGYAAFMAQQIMIRMGIKSGLVNASGDIICWGKPPDKTSWDIKIPNPEDMDDPLFNISIPFGAMVTSGDYESYTLIDGKRYSHIIDPRTGMPVRSLKSVTVICPNPEFGDALATAVSVMGAEAGIALINRLNGVECLVIDQDNKKYLSKQLKTFLI